MNRLSYALSNFKYYRLSSISFIVLYFLSSLTIVLMLFFGHVIQTSKVENTKALTGDYHIMLVGDSVDISKLDHFNTKYIGGISFSRIHYEDDNSFEVYNINSDYLKVYRMSTQDTINEGYYTYSNNIDKIDDFIINKNLKESYSITQKNSVFYVSDSSAYDQVLVCFNYTTMSELNDQLYQIVTEISMIYDNDIRIELNEPLLRELSIPFAFSSEYIMIYAVMVLLFIVSIYILVLYMVNQRAAHLSRLIDMGISDISICKALRLETLISTFISNTITITIIGILIQILIRIDIIQISQSPTTLMIKAIPVIIFCNIMSLVIYTFVVKFHIKAINSNGEKKTKRLSKINTKSYYLDILLHNFSYHITRNLAMIVVSTVTLTTIMVLLIIYNNVDYEKVLKYNFIYGNYKIVDVSKTDIEPLRDDMFKGENIAMRAEDVLTHLEYDMYGEVFYLNDAGIDELVKLNNLDINIALTNMDYMSCYIIESESTSEIAIGDILKFMISSGSNKGEVVYAQVVEIIANMPFHNGYFVEGVNYVLYDSLINFQHFNSIELLNANQTLLNKLKDNGIPFISYTEEEINLRNNVSAMRRITIVFSMIITSIILQNSVNILIASYDSRKQSLVVLDAMGISKSRVDRLMNSELTISFFLSIVLSSVLTNVLMKYISVENEAMNSSLHNVREIILIVDLVVLSIVFATSLFYELVVVSRISSLPNRDIQENDYH